MSSVVGNTSEITKEDWKKIASDLADDDFERVDIKVVKGGKRMKTRSNKRKTRSNKRKSRSNKRKSKRR
jgi:hypothetical protein